MKKRWKITLLSLFLLIAACLIGSTTNIDFAAVLGGEEEPDEATVEIYNQRCAGCHGFDGTSVKHQAPDFSDTEFQRQHTDKQLQKSITQGKPPLMPSFESRLSEEQIKALVAYVRYFGKKEKKPSE